MRHFCTYLDVLGYKAMFNKRGPAFEAEFNCFSKDLISKKFDKDYYFSQDKKNKDAFCLAKPYSLTISCSEFQLYCESINTLYLYSFTEYNYLFRGYLLKLNGSSDGFDIGNVPIFLLRSIDKKQKRAVFPRVNIEKKIVPQQILSECYRNHVINKVKRHKSKSFYINPFCIMYQNDSVSEKLYDQLKENIAFLRSHISREGLEPYKKNVWLGILFDKEAKNNNLPYAPLISYEDLVYLTSAKNFKEFIDILQYAQSAYIRLLNYFGGSEEQTYIRLNRQYRELLSKRVIKTIRKYDHYHRLPVNIYEITLSLIDECLENSLISKNEATIFVKSFDDEYLLLLKYFKNKHANSYYGYILETKRNVYHSTRSGVETHLFEFRK